jgi:hypothetical protein
MKVWVLVRLFWVLFEDGEPEVVDVFSDADTAKRAKKALENEEVRGPGITCGSQYWIFPKVVK